MLRTPRCTLPGVSLTTIPLRFRVHPWRCRAWMAHEGGLALPRLTESQRQPVVPAPLNDGVDARAVRPGPKQGAPSWNAARRHGSTHLAATVTRTVQQGGTHGQRPTWEVSQTCCVESPRCPNLTRGTGRLTSSPCEGRTRCRVPRSRTRSGSDTEGASVRLRLERAERRAEPGEGEGLSLVPARPVPVDVRVDDRLVGCGPGYLGEHDDIAAKLAEVGEIALEALTAVPRDEA
jgi:hypothetical protein